MLHRITLNIVRPCLYRATVPRLVAPRSLAALQTTRSFASSHDWQQGISHPLIDKIAQHPHIMDQLVKFTEVLKDKGINVNKQPSFTEIVKVMSDPEVKEITKKLVQDMQAAGITLDMKAVQELQAGLAKYNEVMGQQKEEDENKDQGVLNKVKGLFKK
ncbi:hypothetical protein G6F70_004923 [Rhizopus microsporus]|uniref:Uncharacterized protein n=2 Tax=Rhizopus TaxID=4842 RepID=A0A367K706_RHIAZ|nr:hypothetical protein G6F71_001405 [Rhizopus microsporus]RCH97957.1 hypothetical protein CU097_013952 [Rhizopus azygosporus]KAG1199443.1 hypothetical protein G6F70_004923 [Rhizopus microsporus]KAG1211239.1 hypothetical protein G6F69_004763 [Rhizopus microsporus]KAG1233065.1 hypothetical protein G6F67_004541 [Rhizopus microsporus]